MTLNFKVPSMVCDKCAETVTQAIQSLDQDAKIDVHVQTKDVTAETNASMEAIREAIAARGHTVE